MNAQLNYVFTDGAGRAGTVPLTRLTPDVSCAQTASTVPNGDFGLSGNWYDTTKAGRGLVFELNPVAHDGIRVHLGLERRPVGQHQPGEGRADARELRFLAQRAGPNRKALKAQRRLLVAIRSKLRSLILSEKLTHRPQGVASRFDLLY